jgi:hypothetical protein
MDIKPILFSTDMVQAILDGRKTMTRRVAKFPTGCNPSWTGYQPDGGVIYGSNNMPAVKAKYKVGDVLWVRETWCQLWKLDENDQTIEGTEAFYYAADGYNPTPFNAFPDEYGFIGDRECPRWRPSIFMPKSACRLFLRVTDVRAERLTKISEEDAVREGCRAGDRYAGPNSTPALTAKQSFMWLWNMLNTKRGYPWCADPWVWVYTFERCEKPEGWC